MNSSSLTKAHPVRKIEWIHIDCIPAARPPTRAFLLSHPCALWMLPLAIDPEWMAESHYFPLLSSPFLRPSKQIRISLKCVFIHLRHLFLNGLRWAQESLNAVVSVVCRRLPLEEAGVCCLKVFRGLSVPVCLYLFWSLHLRPLHQSERGSPEFSPKTVCLHSEGKSPLWKSVTHVWRG